MLDTTAMSLLLRACKAYLNIFTTFQESVFVKFRFIRLCSLPQTVLPFGGTGTDFADRTRSQQHCHFTDKYDMSLDI